MSADLVARLRENLRAVIRGKDPEVDLLITAFLAGGNVLLTDVPGVGKTTLAKAIAASIGGTFRRVQFTPDLLPADVLGGSIYNPREGSFSFRQGPVFANVLLADEINRASPRTQSALLEAMAEGQVSIEGTTHALPRPFWVIATQNPVEHHGTYPLPEAQLDRFAVELAMGYPTPEEELKILGSHDEGSPLERLRPVTTPEEVLEVQARVRRVHVDEDVGRYIVDLLRRSRQEPRVSLGVSPRGGIVLYRLAQAHAFRSGRAAVQPDDVKAIAVPALAHRLALETKARYSGVTRAGVVRELLERAPVPV
ncbi:MAG: MoxR family ATPase [Planctomycetes bacterium]|nr:MoxR family ATPase [Planctomycetota bacterium]